MAGYLRFLLLALALVGAGFVSACSGLTPLYSSASIGAADYSFTYGKPASRSDQIIYRELRLRLPASEGATETLAVTVSSSTGARKLGRNGPHEMIAVANVTMTRADGSVVFSGQRIASSAYGYVGQVLADKQAEVDASERASVAVAESVRLALLSALAR